MKKQGTINNKKIRGQFYENIRTKWTAFICWRTGLIRRWTGFIRRADEAKLPTDEASPIGPYIFSYFSLFQMFSFCLQQDFYHQDQL